MPVRSPKPPARRLTITPPVIAARALRSTGSPDEVPARLAREGVWFLDREAARLLAD